MTPSLSGFEKLIRAFEDLCIEYLIGGSVASSVFGRFRATNDIDILAALPPAKVRPLVEKIVPVFIAFEDDILDALRAKRPFNLIERKTIVKVDIFPATTAFERAQLKRATRLPIEFLSLGLQVCVASPEDILLAKLRWFRMGGEISERQWSDIRGVVEIQRGKLDLAYLNRWAKELSVEDLLVRALH